jgi:hypothetical protein
MTIILALVKLLGSAGFGTIFGGVMGLLNRKVDIQAERMKYDHERDMRKLDAEIIEKEWAAREKVAVVEGQTKAEVAAYEALSKSYEFAKPAKGGKMEAFGSFIRPFVSLGYFIVTSAGSAYILYYAFHVAGLKLTVEQLFELVMYVIAWVAFMGGATIGWWFAMRPGGKMPTLTLR